MPNPEFTPVQNEGIIGEEMDGEVVVYDRSSRRAVHLNETAAVVWKLCDGQRTVGEISALLSEEYPESASEIDGDIGEAIDSMVARRIMTLIEPV